MASAGCPAPDCLLCQICQMFYEISEADAAVMSFTLEQIDWIVNPLPSRLRKTADSLQHFQHYDGCTALILANSFTQGNAVWRITVINKCTWISLGPHTINASQYVHCRGSRHWVVIYIVRYNTKSCQYKKWTPMSLFDTLILITDKSMSETRRDVYYIHARSMLYLYNNYFLETLNCFVISRSVYIQKHVWDYSETQKFS